MIERKEFIEVASMLAMLGEISREGLHGSMAKAEQELGWKAGEYKPVEHHPILVARRSVNYAKALWDELERDKNER